MQKIVILRCLKSEENCTGAACLKAFNNKTGYFSRYAKEEVQLSAFLSCNGCGNIKFNGEIGLNEKLKRILSIKPDVIHIGICCQTRVIDKTKCNNILKMVKFFEENAIKVIWGTHS